MLKFLKAICFLNLIYSLFSITICYEGQLSGDNVHDEFWVPNINESNAGEDRQIDTETVYHGNTPKKREEEDAVEEKKHSIKITKDCKEANNGLDSVHGFNVAVKWVYLDSDSRNTKKVRIMVLTSSIFSQEYVEQ